MIPEGAWSVCEFRFAPRKLNGLKMLFAGKFQVCRKPATNRGQRAETGGYPP